MFARVVECLRYLAFLLVIAALGWPRAVLAETEQSQWIELIRACEAVLTDQDFTPLANYKPAPFSMGLPGKKRYAVYNNSQDLVAIATVVRGDWVECLVHESKEVRVRRSDTLRWRELATEWENDFKENFPRSNYHWVTWPLDPNRPFPGALRCEAGKPTLLIGPYIDLDFHFRVGVSNDFPSKARELCEK